MITKQELQEWLKISHTTVDKLLERGIPYYKTSINKCGQLRFEKEEVLEWLRKNTIYVIKIPTEEE